MCPYVSSRRRRTLRILQSRASRSMHASTRRCAPSTGRPTRRHCCEHLRLVLAKAKMCGKRSGLKGVPQKRTKREWACRPSRHSDSQRPPRVCSEDARSPNSCAAPSWPIVPSLSSTPHTTFSLFPFLVRSLSHTAPPPCGFVSPKLCFLQICGCQGKFRGVILTPSLSVVPSPCGLFPSSSPVHPIHLRFLSYPCTCPLLSLLAYSMTPASSHSGSSPWSHGHAISPTPAGSSLWREPIRVDHPVPLRLHRAHVH